MKKIWILIFSIINFLHCYNYDNLLIDAQIKLYPKLILLDKNHNKKTINNKIHITIVHHHSDYQKALEIKRKIEKTHPVVTAEIKEFSQIDNNLKSSALYILKGEDKDIEKVTKIASKKHIPTFSYDIEDLKHNCLISLYIEQTPVIYFNNKVHKKYGINFSDLFYQIVRFKDD
jgi:hypothetical protein